jgi:ferric-dicitrate binding protein FerR (iron transport regulator)
VREAPPDALVVTAGFSCRSQIEQETPRRALHIAQVIQLARDHGATGPHGGYPEQAVAPKPQRSSRRRLIAAAAAGVGLAGLAAYASLASR